MTKTSHDENHEDDARDRFDDSRRYTSPASPARMMTRLLHIPNISSSGENDARARLDDNCHYASPASPARMMTRPASLAAMMIHSHHRNTSLASPSSDACQAGSNGTLEMCLKTLDKDES